MWKPHSIRSLAAVRDLYTVFARGKEVDDFELWLCTDVDTPGLESIDRAIRGLQLTPLDWRRMIRLVAAQQVRTPRGLIESVQFANRVFPEVLERTVEKTVEKIKEIQDTGKPFIYDAPPGTISPSCSK